MSNMFVLGLSFAHAVFIAKHYARSDVQRAGNGVIAAILLGIFFLGMCFHRWKTSLLLRIHPTDDAVLSEMNSMLNWATAGLCLLSVLMLHPMAWG